MVCLRLNQNLLEATPTFKPPSIMNKICSSTDTFSRHMLSEHKHNSCECDPFTVLEFSSFQIPELTIGEYSLEPNTSELPCSLSPLSSQPSAWMPLLLAMGLVHYC